MIATFNLNETELTEIFLDKLKNMFKGQDLKIVVEEDIAEDIALKNAIEIGLKSETISKEQFLKALSES